jgi:hypothetical protein
MDMLFNNAPSFFCPDMMCFSALVTTLTRHPLPPIPSGNNAEESSQIMENGIGHILMEWAGQDPKFKEALERLTEENDASISSGHLGSYTFWAQSPFA